MENNISTVILTAMDLEVHYGQQIILNKASLSIHEGDRIGLVGRIRLQPRRIVILFQLNIFIRFHE